MYSTPADLSCCTNSAPPEPCTSRIAEAGALAESDCAIALTATEPMPSADRPVISLRREMPLSRYCLIRSFIEWTSQGFLSCCRPRHNITRHRQVKSDCWRHGNKPLNRARRDVHGQREQCGVEHERHHAVAEDGAADRPAA